MCGACSARRRHGRSTSRCDLLLPSGYGAAHLAEIDEARRSLLATPASYHDLVTILKPRPRRAIVELDRIAPSRGDLHEASGGVRSAARDRARREQVAGARGRAVRSEVGELLSHRPVKA